MPPEGVPSEKFPRSHRLRKDLEFQAVYGSRHRRQSGPLLVYGRPNDLAHQRLGLSVGRKVGGAVKRVRIKRQLREAFRLMLPRFQAGFDFIVVVRPHRVATAEDYRRHLEIAMRKVVAEWTPKEDTEQDQSPGC